MTAPICVACGMPLERDRAGLHCPRCAPTLPPDASMEERLAFGCIPVALLGLGAVLILCYVGC